MTINIAGRWNLTDEAPKWLPDPYREGRPIRDWGLCIEFKGARIQTDPERKLIEEELLKYYMGSSEIDPKYHLTQADAFAGGYYLYAKNPELLNDDDAKSDDWLENVINNIANAIAVKFGEEYCTKNLLVEDQLIFGSSDVVEEVKNPDDEPPSSPGSIQTFLYSAPDPAAVPNATDSPRKTNDQTKDSDGPSSGNGPGR